MSKLHDLHTFGQSPWLDYIRKDMVHNGELASLIEQGVRGVTSNPTIFENAIVKSNLYEETIQALGKEGKTKEEIYDALAFSDIKQACDLLLSVYHKTDRADGFVSLEVPPALCDDHRQTIEEAKRIWKAIDRPNLMIKVPATKEGLLAITALIGEGINVNVTLMFTKQDYREVAKAYIDGLVQLDQHGGDLAGVASVASVFVSRIDSAIESQVKEPLLSSLLGKVALANTRAIYQLFLSEFQAERFLALAKKGARVQRPLWASTGTKNKSLSDTLYIDQLIGKDTVNTMPPATMEAFMDHGISAQTVDAHREEDQSTLQTCEEHGIDLEAIGHELQQKGLQAFSDSFVSLMNAIETVRQRG